MSLFLQRLEDIAKSFSLLVQASNPKSVIVGADAIIAGSDGRTMANVCIADGAISIFETSYMIRKLKRNEIDFSSGSMVRQEHQLLLTSLADPDLERQLCNN